MALTIGSEPMRVSRRTASSITRGEKAVATATMLGYALLRVYGPSESRQVREMVCILAPGIVLVPAFVTTYSRASSDKCQAWCDLACACPAGVLLGLISQHLAQVGFTDALHFLRPDT